MGKKKNQHYVPKFILKNFSNSQNRKTINIYLRKENQLVENGSIKDQCKKDYLYGKDLTIEDAFMELEGSVASILKKIFLNIDELKKLSLEEDINIREFLLYQQLRTLAAKEETNQLTNDFAQMIIQYDPFLSKHQHKFEITLSNPIIENLQVGADSLKYILDLEIGLLYSGEKEFAISDNPSFTINPFLNLRKWEGSGLGLGSIGIILLMPVHPKYCICLYDSMIYALSDRYHHVLSTNDIDKINSLILYYSSNNIYFKSKDMFHYMRNLKEINLVTARKKILNQKIEKVYKNGKLQKNTNAFMIGKEIIPFDCILRSIPFTNTALDLPISTNMDMNREYVKKTKMEDPNFNY